MAKSLDSARSGMTSEESSQGGCSSSSHFRHAGCWVAACEVSHSTPDGCREDLRYCMTWSWPALAAVSINSKSTPYMLRRRASSHLSDATLPSRTAVRMTWTVWSSRIVNISCWQALSRSNVVLASSGPVKLNQLCESALRRILQILKALTVAPQVPQSLPVAGSCGCDGRPVKAGQQARVAWLLAGYPGKAVPMFRQVRHPYVTKSSADGFSIADGQQRLKPGMRQPCWHCSGQGQRQLRAVMHGHGYDKDRGTRLAAWFLQPYRTLETPKS